MQEGRSNDPKGGPSTTDLLVNLCIASFWTMVYLRTKSVLHAILFPLLALILPTGVYVAEAGLHRGLKTRTPRPSTYE